LDIFLAIPLAFLLAYLNKLIFQQLGYEKFMCSPGGARLNQVVFVLVNLWLVVDWSWQLMAEVKMNKEERIRELKEEIRYRDGEIEILERLMEVCVLACCLVRMGAKAEAYYETGGAD
jgi:hypothetical protein